MAQNDLKTRRNWTREETLAAFNIYSRTPFGRLHARNPDIVHLGRKLGRTASAVAMKCCNLAALDPTLQARGVTGLRGISRMDRQIWDEFHASPESIGYESELVISKLMNRPARMIPANDPVVVVAETDREAVRRVRTTQHLFRAIILTSYAECCAVCAWPARELLVASHIIGWAVDASHRMNPRNGICLCSFHDRAFDAAMIDVDDEFFIRVTARCHVDRSHRVARDMLYRFDGVRMRLPDRWQPDPKLLTRRRILHG